MPNYIGAKIAFVIFRNMKAEISYLYEMEIHFYLVYEHYTFIGFVNGIVVSFNRKKVKNGSMFNY